MNNRTHKDLEVWKMTIELVINIYRITKNFPPQEQYGLASQMRRAAVSIPANIAEGAARGTKKEYSRFIYIARGSVSELETYLEIAMHLSYLLPEINEDLEAQITSIGRMLTRLVQSLKSQSNLCTSHQ